MAKEGRRQSPIDITPDSAVDATSHSREKPLKWVYNTKHCLNIENTGSSWKVNVNGCGSCRHFFVILLKCDLDRGLDMFENNVFCSSFGWWTLVR